MDAPPSTHSPAPNEHLQRVVRQLLLPGERLRVLEAGCGSTSHIDLGRPMELSGIDVSQAQLGRHARLDHSLLGDLQTFPLPRAYFDVVVCWDVLEHLPRPADAIRNMLESLRPGGMLVLAFPHLLSVKGLITRLTPYRFHRWFYRVVMGDLSSDEDSKQFRTYLHADILPGRVNRQVRALGCDVSFVNLYEGPVQKDMRQKHRIADFCFRAITAVSRVFSFRTADLAHSDCHMIVLKP